MHYVSYDELNKAERDAMADLLESHAQQGVWPLWQATRGGFGGLSVEFMRGPDSPVFATAYLLLIG